MKRLLLLSTACIGCFVLHAQDSTKTLHLSFYAELYYQYDFNKPADGNRPGFVYSHNRHNEFNLNLGIAKASCNRDRIRAALALGTGTYMNANYAAEPGVLKNVFEADAGIRVSRKKNIWLDAGIMPSHIGFESAVSKDCPTLTRSMAADNSPYYEAGAKLSYTSDNTKWLVSVLALNGWQRITRVSGNSLLSWGTQLQYKPSEKLLLNYSTFLGSDKPDSARQLRFFHNLYGIFTVSSKMFLITGLDIGSQKKLNGGYDTWYSPVIIAQYRIHPNWAIAARSEYYNDPGNVMISSPLANGFKAAGISLNFDHSPDQHTLIRLEVKNLLAKEAVFTKGNRLVKHTTSVALSFSCNF